MNTREYLTKLNAKCQEIFASTIDEHKHLGKVHQIASALYEFSTHLTDEDERGMLRVAAAQLETSCLTLCFGLYRQALGALRLSFEIGLGCVYFSTNKIEQKEWLQGRADIKWAVLIESDTGLFSTRFADAFFSELRGHSADYGARAKGVYRQLSEFVHGNNETWQASGIAIVKNDELISKYFGALDELSEILAYALCCRYLKGFNASDIEEVGAITEVLSHLSPIRMITGGPKDIL